MDMKLDYADVQFANDGRFGNYTGYVLSKYL